MVPINIADYERVARERLSKMAYDYYASGADDEITLQENITAYRRLKLQYRVLRGIKQCNLSTTILGQKLSMPIIIAPTGFHCLAHPEGELATAQAAQQAGIIMTLSTASTYPMEEVATAANSALWFQLYMYKDKGLTRQLVQRAERAGCAAIVLTVDAPVLGRRERDIRNGFHLPEGVTLKNFAPTSQQANFPQVSGSGLAAYTAQMFKLSLSWDDVAWLTSITKLPVLIKGVCHPEDARIAIEHGIAGVIISNHGGRQLDTAPPTIEVLPQIAAEIDQRITIIIDGGIRRGSHVLKALALGADAVAIGRPVLWGLAVDGIHGVSHILEMLRYELSNSMALCGCATIDEITPDLIFNPVT